MRVDIKKFIFVGIEEDRKRFFERSQELGFIQFIDYKKVQAKSIPKELEKINSAIRILRSFHSTEQEEMDDYTLSDEIACNILNIKELLDKLFEQQRVTKLEISRVRIFGDFSINDIEVIEKEGHRKIQFFSSKNGLIDEKPLPKDLFYVGTDNELNYFFSIRKETGEYEDMIEMHISKPLGTLVENLNSIEFQIREAEEKLKEYVKYNTYLHQAFIEKLNHFHLYSNQEYSQPALNDCLFSVKVGFQQIKYKLLKI